MMANYTRMRNQFNIKNTYLTRRESLNSKNLELWMIKSLPKLKMFSTIREKGKLIYSLNNIFILLVPFLASQNIADTIHQRISGRKRFYKSVDVHQVENSDMVMLHVIISHHI